MSGKEHWVPTRYFMQVRPPFLGTPLRTPAPSQMGAPVEDLHEVAILVQKHSGRPSLAFFWRVTTKGSEEGADIVMKSCGAQCPVIRLYVQVKIVGHAPTSQNGTSAECERDFAPTHEQTLHFVSTPSPNSRVFPLFLKILSRKALALILQRTPCERACRGQQIVAYFYDGFPNATLPGNPLAGLFLSAC